MAMCELTIKAKPYSGHKKCKKFWETSPLLAVEKMKPIFAAYFLCMYHIVSMEKVV